MVSRRAGPRRSWFPESFVNCMKNELVEVPQQPSHVAIPIVSGRRRYSVCRTHPTSHRGRGVRSAAARQVVSPADTSGSDEGPDRSEHVRHPVWQRDPSRQAVAGIWSSVQGHSVTHTEAIAPDTRPSSRARSATQSGTHTHSVTRPRRDRGCNPASHRGFQGAFKKAGSCPGVPGPGGRRTSAWGGLSAADLRARRERSSKHGCGAGRPRPG